MAVTLVIVVKQISIKFARTLSNRSSSDNIAPDQIISFPEEQSFAVIGRILNGNQFNSIIVRVQTNSLANTTR